MKIIIGNVQSQAVIGGVDNLLPFNLQKELKSYLSMKVPGYNFSPKFKQFLATGKGWDGTKYFITEAGFFATGFLPAVLKYLLELEAYYKCELKIDIEDKRGEIPKMNTGDAFDRSVGKGSRREIESE